MEVGGGRTMTEEWHGELAPGPCLEAEDYLFQALTFNFASGKLGPNLAPICHRNLSAQRRT